MLMKLVKFDIHDTYRYLRNATIDGEYGQQDISFLSDEFIRISYGQTNP